MMKNYISYKLIGLALLIVSIVACDTADQDVSPIISPDGKPIATFTTDFTGSTINEGDTLKYIVTTNKAQDRAITFSARINSGTLTDDDIEVIPGVLSPYTTSATVEVVFLKDWEDTADETAVMEFGAFSIADRYQPNLSTVNPILNLTVLNYVSPELTVSLDWSKEVVVQDIVSVKVNVGTYYTVLDDTVDVTTDAGAEVDFDIYVLNSSNHVVAYAATGDCPEVLALSGLPDGEYTIITDLWANGFLYYYHLYDNTELLPVTSTFTRQGTTLNQIVEQAESEIPTIITPGADDAADGGFNGYVATVIVANGKYTIEDAAGNSTGPWKGGKFSKPGFINKTK